MARFRSSGTSIERVGLGGRLMIELISPGFSNFIIFQILKDVHNHISEHRDSPLALNEKPYDLEVDSQEATGCYFSVEEEPGRGTTHSAYSKLEETMIAL